MRIGVIVLDTLRYDTFKELSQSLQSQADHSFDRMYSTSRWTSPAHASLFTGKTPTETGVGANSRSLPDNSSTIAGRLNNLDYRSVALSNNVHIDPFFGFTRGFDDFCRGPVLEGRPTDNQDGFDWDELFSTMGSGPLRYLRALMEILRNDEPTIPTLRTGLQLLRSTSVNQQSDNISWAFNGFAEKLPEVPDNLFFFANLMPTHYPYNPPDDYSPVEPFDTPPLHLTLRDDPVTNEEHVRHWQNYRGAARYLDDELPKLIDKVDWDCLFVISDHGELFGEHGFRGHEYGLYEELVHVPAIAIGDKVPEGTTEDLTSILDIHRTLLELAGVDVPDHIRGYNLFEDDIPEGRAVYAESTGVGQYSPDAKGILANIPPEWDEEHYMLRTKDAMLVHDYKGTRVFDPETGDDLPERESELRKRVKEVRADRDLFSGDQDDQDVPDDVEDRLAHLGYK